VFTLLTPSFLGQGLLLGSVLGELVLDGVVEDALGVRRETL
jgi:hypothetical protein